MNEANWSKRKNLGVNVIKRKKKGNTEYQLLETFDRTSKDPARHYYRGIISPEPVGDPNYLGPDKTAAEKLFDEQTK